MSNASKKTVSIIVPCYNEAEVIEMFLEAVKQVAAGLPHYGFEFLFVDDGSQDGTEALLTGHAQADPRIKLACLSRNYGHQRAISAGLDLCTGHYAIVVDADLQDPPERIPDILEQLEAGFDVVHMVRSDRRVDSLSKRFSAKLFYMLMRRWVLPDLPEDAGDFKGFSRPAIQALRQYRERVRFLRGLVATLGFKQTRIPYVRAPRYAGKSKYPLRNVLRLARDAIVSNTVLPLRLSLCLGLFVCALWPVLVVVGLVLAYVTGGVHQSLLWALGVLMTGFFGIILLLFGILGEYLKCVVLEVKQRPLYLVRRMHNLGPPPPQQHSR